MTGHRVLDHSVGEQVEELAPGTEATGSPQVELVVDLAVEGLGVAAPPHEPDVVGVAGWDLADVLGPVEGEVDRVVGRLDDHSRTREANDCGVRLGEESWQGTGIAVRPVEVEEDGREHDPAIVRYTG